MFFLLVSFAFITKNHRLIKNKYKISLPGKTIFLKNISCVLNGVPFLFIIIFPMSSPMTKFGICKWIINPQYSEPLM
jgi:hypothetical protein